VTLSSSGGSASVPASVSVAGDAMTADFAVSTIPVAVTTSIEITGNYNGQQSVR